MNVLSLFDGISCGQYVLRERLGFKNLNYYASEIEKAAIKNTLHNYPDTIQLGDVRGVKGKDLPKIDLLIGGSPCQGFSFLGKQLAFDDPRSKLFFEYVRLLREVKPRFFLLENVRMKKQYENVITKYLNVAPIYIDSALFSAQSRKRLYWTNIPINPLPEKEATIYLRECLDEPYYKSSLLSKYTHLFETRKKLYRQDMRPADVNKKAPTITKQNWLNIPISYHECRKPTQIELERLCGLREGFTSTMSHTQAKEAIGNAWECNTITFLFQNLLKYYKR